MNLLTIDKAISNHIKSYVTLTGIRVFQDEIPETNSVYPAMAYSLISGVDDHCFTEDPDSTESSWQFTIVAETAASRTAVWLELKAAFQDFSGVMGGTGGINVLSALQANRRDDHDTATGLYLRMVDFDIMHEEN